ncbi:hypothetical protein ASD45_08600 [Pseudolabrys sp. Root1462]|uniref:hypothetical protein n=1 Tax=Pseudolabrys sp. Root1462 TaxID=1736466 RepID=UPI000702889D|nr:hypothetical protein [Pseudolabrys sp. Root1462]KQZ00913.1 hypothetical protein ASD45_08600 [Pseudolabrys sp. Root1462]
MRSSQAAFDKIVGWEVSSQAVYQAKYRRPEWPGEQSGPTVGIGYDLGQTDKATIHADWFGRVPTSMLDLMVAASGKTGAAGKAATAAIRNDIDIPWEVALAVHKECVLPRWEAKVAKALPNTEFLSADCFGVLTSLTFNRGASFAAQGDRYIEMRAIKAHMAAKEFAKIPDELRAMKRLWPDSRGLRDRRDAEAALFERGLHAPVAMPTPAAPSQVPPITPQPVPPAPAGIDPPQAASAFELIAKLITAIIGAFKGSKS